MGMSDKQTERRFSEVFGEGRGPKPPRDSPEDRSDHFMIDPSLLLTRSKLTWARKRDVSEAAVISKSFYEAVRHGRHDSLLPFVASRDRDTVGLAAEALRPVLRPMEKFSHRSVTSLPTEAEAVRVALEASKSPGADILADEWSYLVTHSWLVAKRKAVLTRIRRAGADVLEITPRPAIAKRREDVIRQLISVVIPEAKVPAVLTPDVWQKAEIKWVIYVGAIVQAGSPWGAFTLPFIRAFDP